MSLKDSILKTIAWFDIFDFPLTAEEVMEHLYDYKKPVHIKEIKGTLDLLSSEAARANEEENDEGHSHQKPEGPLEKIKDYYVLRGRATIVEKRKTRKFIAEKLWSRTKLYGRYLRNVPFVRMIAVCNNLSFENPSEQSDIDLFIVIQSGRMWLARLIISLILQFHGVRRHGDKIVGRFCLSFFVSEKRLNMAPLQLKPHDPYLAYWTKFLAPIYGEDTYERFKQENEGWLREQYGLTFSDSSKIHLYADKEGKGKGILEWIFSRKIGDFCEKFLKKTFKKRTLRKMKHLGPEASVIVNDDMLKFHNNDRRKEYYEGWIKTSERESI